MAKAAAALALTVLLLQTASLVSGCYDTSTQAEGAEQVHWDYSDGEHGPAHWYKLKPEWGVCKTGLHQSPIHITGADMVTEKSLVKPLDARYRGKIAATIANDGHAVVVDLAAKSGELRIGGVTYYPAQFHFHMPSEHVVMNQSFPLEMHLVHKSDDGKLAVVGYLFTEGEESEFLAQFVNNLPPYTEKNVKRDIGKIYLLKQKRNFGRYMGSLTTPPCAENVTWTVMLWNFPTASSHQLKLLRDSVPTINNRPTFPSDGRNFRISF